MADDLRKHIFLPVPPLTQPPNPPASREEKLKDILKNLETQQQQVRNNIILAAKRRLDEQLQLQSQTTLDSPHSPRHPDSMDLDTPHSPYSEGEIDSQGNSQTNPPPPPPPDTSATDLLLANLNAPYHESMGDPCVTSTSNRPAPPPGIRQVTPPPQIVIAKETLAQIEEYDRYAEKAKEYYVKALERRKGSAGTDVPMGGVPPPPPPPASLPPHAIRDPRARGR